MHYSDRPVSGPETTKDIKFKRGEEDYNVVDKRKNLTNEKTHGPNSDTKKETKKKQFQFQTCSTMSMRYLKSATVSWPSIRTVKRRSEKSGVTRK